MSKNISSCGKVADEINASGRKAEAWAFDVSKSAEVKDACSQILKKYKAVDIIVNNAGITRDNLLMLMSDEQWEDVISTNLSSCFYIVRNLVRAMMGTRRGRIINIASVSGQAGNAGQANYAAAKAGIIGFTKSLAPGACGAEHHGKRGRARVHRHRHDGGSSPRDCGGGGGEHSA